MNKIRRRKDESIRRLEREIDDELSFHLDMRAGENRRAGMPPETARRSARERFGDLEAIRRRGREIRGRRHRRRRLSKWLGDARQDARFALRNMRSAPAPTAVALLALTLGIGATTAVFSVVDGVLLDALPYRDPARLAVVLGQAISRERMEAFRTNLDALQSIGFFTIANHELVGPQGARSEGSIPLSEELFSVLGVQPSLGRVLSRADFAPGAPAALVIGDRIWRDTFNADPDVVGSTLALDGLLYTVVGVMPPGFAILNYSEYDLFVPLSGQEVSMAIARLEPGATFERARIEVEALAASFALEPAPRGSLVTFRSAIEQVTGGERDGVLLLAGAVALVMLIACANVANLLLARAADRGEEIALRLALGAGRGRLVRQLLVESGMLALSGCALGVLTAYWSLPGLLALRPRHFAPADNIAIDLRVLGFAAALSVLTSVLCGLAPATLVRRSDLRASIAGGDRRSIGSRSARRVLNTLVVVEIALSLVLLVGAGLLARTFLELNPSSPGFEPRGKLTFEIRLPARRYGEAAAQTRFYDRTLAELRRLPGVEGAAAISSPPMVGMIFPMTAVPAGTDATAEGLPTLWYETASSNYHELMGIALVRGRGLASATPELPEMVVSERAARALWPQQDALGRHVTLQDPRGDREVVVVGVAADTRRLAGSTTPRPTVWLSYRNAPDNSRMTFIVQTRGAPEELGGAVRALVERLDPELPTRNVQTMGEILSSSMDRPRFYLVLVAIFGVIAVVLASIGFYGVMAYAVGRRTHELGVRLALGASPAQIRRLVLRQGATITALGLAVGLAGCLALSRALESLLYGVSPTDPATYGVLVLVVAALGLLASYVPARRATRVDPTIALRRA